MTRLLANAAEVGSGYAFINLAVTGSQRFCGMTLPGKGWRVNGPAGERDRRQRVVDRARTSLKSPCRIFKVGTVLTNTRPSCLTEAVVVGEEERLVPDNRPADGAAELILLERRLGLPGAVGEEIVGVEPVVAQELVAHAVNRVAAGFGHDIDLSAGIASLLGGVEVGLNLELLDGLDVRTHRRSPASAGCCCRSRRTDSCSSFLCCR